MSFWVMEEMIKTAGLCKCAEQLEANLTFDCPATTLAFTLQRQEKPLRSYLLLDRDRVRQ